MRPAPSIPSPADIRVVGECTPEMIRRSQFMSSTRDTLLDVFRDNQNQWLPVAELARKRGLTANKAMSVIRKFYNTFETDRKTEGDDRIILVRANTTLTRYWQ